MARPGVTYLDVANAAQQLVAAGRMPTIETIRIALGTGSNSTLGNHLRTWKAKQDQTQQIATKENIPEELIAALKGVWERVMGQSDEKIQAVQQEAQQELIILKQENQHLQKETAQWQQQYQQIKQERDGLIHEKLAIEQLLANSKIEIATLIEKSIGFEQQVQDKQEHINELRRQNQQIQANLEHYRNASLEQRLADQQRYEQQQSELEHTIQKLNQKLTDSKNENESVQQQTHQTVSENNNLKTQLLKLESQHESIMSRLTDSISELAKVTQAQQYWHDQSQKIQIKYDEQNKAFIEIRTQHAVLTKQVEVMKKEAIEMREQNNILAHDKWILGQEKAQLYGQLKQLECSV